MTDREYKEKYLEDINNHKPAEQITLQVLNNLHNGFTFEDVTDDEGCYTKGDIKMTKGDKVRFVDVKDDGVIATSGNFCVEAGGWSKRYNHRKKGWIDSKYDYVAVISQAEQVIWILSFKRLKQIYKNIELTGGRKVTTEFWDNIKYSYLVPVHKAIELDAVLAKIEYEYDDWNEEYIPSEYISKSKLKAC